jgi:hypothetical protein
MVPNCLWSDRAKEHDAPIYAADAANESMSRQWWAIENFF